MRRAVILTGQAHADVHIEEVHVGHELRGCGHIREPVAPLVGQSPDKDVPLFRLVLPQGFQEIEGRHASLRTSFSFRESK